MENPILSWSVDMRGFTFECKVRENLLPPDKWAQSVVCLPNGKRASLAPILSLLEYETSAALSEESVTIPHKDVAKFDSSDLDSVGLPGHIPYRLSIKRIGLLTDSNFRFSYNMWHPEGRPVMGYKRTGALLEVGEQQYTVPDPIYSLVTSMDSFNEKPPSDKDSRLYEWGTIKELLPEDIQVDQYLKEFNVLKADAFTIKPYTNENGEPDFDPVLVYRKRKESLLLNEDNLDIQEILPPARQTDFSKYFRRLKQVNTSYTAGGGYYVVLPEPVQKVLSVVKRIQKETTDKRIEFIKNPTAIFRSELGDEFADTHLEALFCPGDDYGDRVKKIGVWQPKVLPFLSNYNNEWLPSGAPGEEEIGILINDEPHNIIKDDVPELIEKLESAIKDGKPYVEYNGENIPATKEALAAVQRLKPFIKPDTSGDKIETLKSDSKTRIVLLIKDNLGNLEYRWENRSSDISENSIPGSLKWKLYPHQSSGVNWLQEHWRNGNRGALLADDMGLGKTVQTLTFLAWAQNHQGFNHLPILIVAPTGLLQNWIDEHDSCLDAPGLGERLDAYGSTLKQIRDINTGKAKELEGGLPVLNLKKIKRAEWVLTTYETLRDYQHSFGKIHFSVLVFDEAQKVKNPSSLMTEALKAMNADFFLALTGTPVENRLTDLWCIVDAVQPGKLGSCKEFTSKYEKNLHQSENVKPSSDAFVHKLPDDRRLALQDLKEKLEQPPAIMMRRMKKDHLDGLPKKIVLPYKENMPDRQATAYKEAINLALSDRANKKHILETLQQLRSISLHPYLQLKEDDTDYIKASAKLNKTFDILDAIKKKGEKALVFLESRKMQGILSELIQRRYMMNKALLLINGEVSGVKRKERVDDFQNRHGFDVMILSPKAGGVGLNLTAANHVIHLSRWWNPAVEDQCTDRVFRIGQKRPVHIYYPLSIHPEFQENSFDIKVDNLLQRKRQLSHNLLSSPAPTHQEAEDLFNETVKEAKWEPDLLQRIDLFEPKAFEEWVRDSLLNKNFSADRTQSSYDGGADIVAVAPDKSCSFLIQCKHTQTDNLCGANAITEICNSTQRYLNLAKPIKLIVITNAKGFNEAAISLSEKQNVKLIDRNKLHQLSYHIEN